MSNLNKFNYEGFEISFNSGDSIMVNATEMAKAFGKAPKDWLRTNQANEFIQSLSSVRHISLSQMVVVNKGNSNVYEQGTWMHEDVALEFARWLSPRFAIWCNDRIKELLKFGVTGSEDAILDIISNPSNAIKLLEALQKERQAKNILEHQNKLQSAELKLSAPKVQYVDDVLLSSKTYTFTQIAKELNMTSAKALTNILKEKNIIYRQSGQWLLSALYCGRDYTKVRTHTYTDSEGSIGTNSITVWTEKGRMFLHQILK